MCFSLNGGDENLLERMEVFDNYKKDGINMQSEAIKNKDENREYHYDQKGEKPVEKMVLDNGMTILVRPLHTIPRVSIQLWYNVGSKDEKTSEKGVAHLIEHMIFKGTQGKNSLNISESDINVITYMLSGSCNAFTSYDYTGYLFNFPTHHWREALPIMADCMQHCAFKTDHLNSEMKAVIQELKMYRDRYENSLVDELMAVIFNDHPYHCPIIGYKHDLWSMTSNDLHSFYKKHYVPNNAVLVVVGDVDSAEAFELASTCFAHIPANQEYRKEKFKYTEDIVSKSVTLFRDIKQPLAMATFVVPGLMAGQGDIMDLLVWILGKGKGSRLYRKLVDELQIVTSLEVFYEHLLEYGLLVIAFEPKKISDIEAIEKLIHAEIADIIAHGIKKEELQRAFKKAKMHLYTVLEETERQAYEIGKYFVALGDEQYLFNRFNIPYEKAEAEIKKILTQYCRPSIMHQGIALPLSEPEKKEWLKLQAQSDREDSLILSERIRNSEIEKPVYAHNIEIFEPHSFCFPKATSKEFQNGLKVLYHHNENTPKINLILSFKAKHFYDPENLQGLNNFVSRMITEGTENYSATELAHELESRGMSLVAYPGGISMSMLHDDFEKGLELLHEVICRATFNKREIEKIRAHILADIKSFWDEPRYFSSQLINEQIYKGHPYCKNSLGNEQSIKRITKKDLMQFYKQYFTPHATRLAIVGDLHSYDVPVLVEKTLGAWQGLEVEDLEYPQLAILESQKIDYPINRDQVLLCLAGRSITRKNPDFDKLLLFDQIFGGGVLHSMNSRLFQLREQSGLFYTINGTLIAHVNEQPGMVLVKTIVSLDRLAEAEAAIKKTIDTVVPSISVQEITEARRAIINALVENFESNNNIASAFLFLDRYDFPFDYFDSRAQQLSAITLEEIQAAVQGILHNDALLTFRIGRIADTQTEGKRA